MSNTRVDIPAISISRGTTRRSFLTWTAAVSAAAFTPAMLGGTAEAQSSLPAGSLGSGSMRLDNPFALGVASGDPLPDSVILWTRLAPKPLEIGGGMPPVAIPVEWEIATDEAFGSVVDRGTAIADPAHAHSVHVDVKGLEAWRVYYYRFRAGGSESPVGRTRTSAPLGADLGSLSFAWASCQAWHDGYYNAYEDMAERENDVIFFLGDYIYESELKDNGIRDMSALSADVRAEPYTLDQYRLRYGLYKSEEPLQRAHASAPWIVTMDDHEVDNNWAAEISQDDDDPVEFLSRRAQAFKVWWEHTPTRVTAPTGPDMRIYRRTDYGNLVRFSVLDTRQYRSNQVHDDKNSPQDAETADPSRTITGDEQEKWILDGLDPSPTAWNVLAHQTVISDLPRVKDGQRNVSMDGWSGYEASRHRILDGAAERGAKNLVSIVGDIHRNAFSELRRDYEDASPAVGVEFAGTSIASGKDGADSDEANEGYKSASEAFKFGNAQRGYIAVKVDKNEWTTEVRVTDKNTAPGQKLHRRATVTVPSGRPELNVQE
ncbi:MAG TPA: alkaline phosphatase D family protein [Dietzia timorensis]|uniref:Alkaline phosphatase D family protein n=1 Tax=Dietzia timorensis TaxID=499555 RepID=A0A921JX70_9ACTN|nr:alkaline phosphatase D family protein [Dietzia timorensis]HJE89508.1 alkaline phosphatase D family protein [Dietzia timorensis]